MKFHKLLFLFLFVTIVTAQEEAPHPELEWYTIETEHFYVHYHKGAERTAQLTAKIAEEIYEPVTSLYNHKPDQKVSWIIKDYDDYSNGASYFYDNKIEIWATSMDFDLRGTHNWLRNVLTHEFTHIIQIQTSMKFGRRIPAFYFQWLGYEAERRPDVLYGFPNVIVSYPLSGFVVPAWFAEGTAQFNRAELEYDFWDTHRDMILRMYALDGNMLSWEEMSVFGKTSLGNESSYNAGFAFVSYIANKYGIDKVVEISRNLSSLTEYSIDGAIKRAIGVDGKTLYNDWRKSLEEEYNLRVQSIKNNLVEGEKIANVGFGNFYPTFSPDGKKVAYVSNKEADYFFLSSLYVYDLEKKQEKKLKEGVRSSLSWSPDGKKIFYSKNTSDNKHWSNVYDIYYYDLETEKEIRITKGRRASYPAIKPDGKQIAYVVNKDGTTNLAIALYDDSLKELKEEILLTNFSNGEQVYNPKWSPDGEKIIFDYSIKDGRDIAIIDIVTKELDFIFSGPEDTRSATYTIDGENILYSSDESGIFNIYKYNLETKQKTQLTNVLGGAFMPSINQNNELVYATYQSTGYKIALMKNVQPVENSFYVKETKVIPAKYSHLASASNNVEFDWQKLNFYDDTKYDVKTSRRYKNIFTSLTFVPVFRVDNYNPRNKGIDIVKPGMYAFSRDVLEKVGLFAGAAINRKFERDLFLIFDYSGKLPLFYQLGLEPKTSLEVYNITRKASSKITLPEDSIGVDVNYNLLQADIVLQQKVFKENINWEIRFSHSRYSAGIESFVLRINDTPVLIPGSNELYLVGNVLSSTLSLDGVIPSTTSEINPIGRKIKLKYDYEFNKFNSEGEYEVKNGMLLPKYNYFKFHRVELNWKEYFKLPIRKHSLGIQINTGSILGPPVDNFFDFYIGGLTGMKGYPFYSLGGNEYFHTNLTYRFPIFSKIDFKILHLYFDKLYGSIYTDIGNAWTGGKLKDVRFKRDAGFELRLESFSWYSFPTRIFFNASYGFDKFNKIVRDGKEMVTYGKEWRFYFGVLFGFELD
ncbi:MAG: tolB protein precursor [Ignavibacteriae bacterium]|nr:MAG: tolB protein precursor [Ignavibacteriota bacterium]